MRNLTCLFAVFSSVAFLSCGSVGSSSSDSVASVEVEKVDEVVEIVEETDTPSSVQMPDLINWKPTYTWEEFAIALGHDVFVDSDLNNYAIWFYDPEHFPIILLISDENKFVALSESDDELDEGAFKVTPIDLPEASGLVNSATLTYEYYDYFSKDIDGDGVEEYVISAEINGMAEADDGMRPVRYIKNAVFSLRDYKVSYSQDMSDQYNKEVGTSENDVNEPMVSLLPKKYYNLDTKPDGLEKSAMLRSLVEDMGISVSSRDGETSFGKVGEEGGNYVVYASFVGTKYFITSSKNDFSELETIDEDFYPLLMDEYQMIDIYSIISARVEDGEVQMELDPRPESEAASGSLSINFNHNGEHWILNSDGNKWFPQTARDNLEKVQDE